MNKNRIISTVVLGLLVCGAPAWGQNPEANKNAFRRLNQEAWSQGQLGVVDALVAPDYVYHEPTLGVVRGPEGLKGSTPAP
jgi:hypothetical protein